MNKYLWSYETIIYTDGTSVDSKKRVIGVYGDTGKDGARGVGVSSVDVMYYKSTSATSLSGGSWVTTDPGWENGKYIWSKTVITYTDKLRMKVLLYVLPEQKDPLEVLGQKVKQELQVKV